ncbi:metallophosphoesterase [Limosilactobacillus sp.]|uniref:metallophosphoesterase n=1 Tax=Limosilactobacillus sp. TaxID=2773925 RepID=UPI00345E70E7
MIIKIAVSSDNHIDVNRQDPEEVLAFQSQWLQAHGIDYYLFAGDLFNNFQKTADYMSLLQSKTPSTKVFYIAGNHDMLGASSEEQIENFASDQYLHNQYVDLPGTDWRLIGNNGWYDYSFSTYRDQAKEVERWKKVFWLDSSTPQDESDGQRVARVLTQSRQQLIAAQHHNKKVLFLTHFAPRHELLAPKPAAVNTPRRERIYQMINAMMGSDALGNLLADYPSVQTVFYGHLHGQHPDWRWHGISFLHQAVGVKNKRINEWQAPMFEQQWVKTLRVMEF